MLLFLFVCLLQLVSHGYWEKDPNVKQVLLWWFKTRRQHIEPDLSWYGWIPVTIWTQTLSLPLAALVLLKPTKFSFSEWYWLEKPSSGFLMLPCFFSGMCQGQCSAFILLIHSKCFLPSFLICFEDEGLSVSCIITFVLAFFSGLFNFKGFQASVKFGRFSGLTRGWNVGSFIWAGVLQLIIIKSAVPHDHSWGVQWLLCHLMKSFFSVHELTRISLLFKIELKRSATQHTQWALFLWVILTFESPQQSFLVLDSHRSSTHLHRTASPSSSPTVHPPASAIPGRLSSSVLCVGSLLWQSCSLRYVPSSSLHHSPAHSLTPILHDSCFSSPLIQAQLLCFYFWQGNFSIWLWLCLPRPHPFHLLILILSFVD